MKPAAMKDGKLYSQQPHSGAGDFNFSRADGVQTRINKHGLIETVANNEPRLSYDLVDGKVSDCPHLLLEPQRGNFGLYSEQLSNWLKSRATSADNQTISPDGSQTAGEAIVTTAFGSHAIYVNQFSSVTSGADYVVSLFVKKSTTKHVRLEDGYSNYGVIFNFDTEEITTKGNASFSDIGVEKYPNGWYRLSVHFLGSSANHSQPALYILRDSDAASSYTGTDEAVFLWGLQVEAGTYHTSYIKNASTGTTTRSADVCNGSGNSETFNDSEGVLFAEIAALADDLTFRSISISNGTTSNRISLSYITTSNIASAYVNTTSGEGFSSSITINNITENNKFAVKYKSGDYSFWINGFETSSGSSSNIFANGTLNTLTFDKGNGGDDMYSNTKQVMTFKKALTDAELEKLTSWESFFDMAKGQQYNVKL